MLRRKKNRQSNLNVKELINNERVNEDQKLNDGSFTERTITNVINQDCAIVSEAASRSELRRFKPSERSQADHD